MTARLVAASAQRIGPEQWGQLRGPPRTQLKFPLNGGLSSLGFGAFDHFWLTSGPTMYEVGGGDCAQYLVK